jgi:catechol 2,3-dioxygenase-like lactoylglutathione lyase family enzyme
MIKTHGLTHTALPVADLERSIRFYATLLGMEVRHRGTDSADLGTPGCHDVMTIQQSQDANIGEMGALGHIGFRLQRAEDPKAIAKAFEDAGGKVTETGHFTPEEPYVFGLDPDGYVIELWYEP